MWSFYFTLLDFLNEKLNWRETKGSKCHDMDEVKQLKEQCLTDPENKLWKSTKHITEVKDIFYHIKSLSYKDKPDYDYVRKRLQSICMSQMSIERAWNSSTSAFQQHLQNPLETLNTPHMPFSSSLNPHNQNLLQQQLLDQHVLYPDNQNLHLLSQQHPVQSAQQALLQSTP